VRYAGFGHLFAANRAAFCPMKKTELTVPLASWVAGGSKFHMLLED